MNKAYQIKTPLGVFETLKEASLRHGVTSPSIMHYLKVNSDNYYLLDQSGETVQYTSGLLTKIPCVYKGDIYTTRDLAKLLSCSVDTIYNYKDLDGQVHIPAGGLKRTKPRNNSK